MSSDLHERRPTSPRWPALCALGAVFGVAFLLGHREIYSPDIGFQLSMGRWILAHGEIPNVDPLTYTLQHRPYVDLQWLYQLGLWGCFSAGGTAAVRIGNTLLTLASFGVMAFRAVRRGSPVSTIGAMLLLVVALGLEWENRPHVASWLLLNLVLLVLEEHGRKGGKTLWLLAPLMLVWVNTHSLYILGLVAIGAFGVVELFQGWTRARPFVVWGAAAGLACLINPYGLQGILFPFTQLGMLQGDSVFKGAAGINEFISAFDLGPYVANRALVLYQPLFFDHLWSVLALGAVAANWRKTPRAELLLFALFAYVFFSGQKNFGYFAVATFPVVLAGTEVWTRAALSRWSPSAAIGQGRIAAVLCVLACAVVGLQINSGYLYANQRLPFHIGHAFSRSFLPVGASGFLNRSDVPEGQMLNDFAAGGFLGFATQRRVFIDGRAELTGPEFFSFWLSLDQPREMTRAIQRYGLDMAIVPIHDRPSWFQYFHTRAGWRRVYEDGRDVVYFRSGFAPHVPKVGAPRAGVDYPTLRPEEQLQIVRAAIQRKDPGFLQSLRGPHRYPIEGLQSSAFYLLTEQPEAALGFGLAALRDATIVAPGLLSNVGHALWQTGRRPLAAECYEAVLASGFTEPGTPLHRALSRRIGQAGRRNGPSEPAAPRRDQTES